jgi:hypothetical protein
VYPKQSDMVFDAAADRDVLRGRVGTVLLWALHLDRASSLLENAHNSV